MIDGTENSSPASQEQALTMHGPVEAGGGCPHPIRRDRGGGMNHHGGRTRKQLLESPLAKAQNRVNGFRWGDWEFGIKRDGQCASLDIQDAVRRKIGWPAGELGATSACTIPDMLLVVDDPLSWPARREDGARSGRS